MSKKKKAKLIMASILFVLGTVGSIYLSVLIDTFLTIGLDGIKLIGLKRAISLVISNKKIGSLFLILELSNILVSAMYFFTENNYYQSEQLQVTKHIKIPVSAGQGQFGTARFMTELEKDEFFSSVEIKKTDSLIKELLEFGTEEYKKVYEEDSKDKENTRASKEVIKVKREKTIEENKLDIDVENRAVKEVEKIIKYKQREDIEKINSINKRDIRNITDGIEEIDKVISIEKKKEKERVIGLIKTLLDPETKERLQNELNQKMEETNHDLKVEIEKLEDGEVKFELLDKFNQVSEAIKTEYDISVKQISEELEHFEIVDSETDLVKYNKLVKDLESRLNTLPKLDTEMSTRLGNKVYNRGLEVIQEEERREKDIKVILSRGDSWSDEY